MSKFEYTSIGLAVVIFIGIFVSFFYNQEKVIEVKLIKIVETNPNEGAWTRIPTYAIYERTDTHERVTGGVLGKEGETFKIKNGRL